MRNLTKSLIEKRREQLKKEKEILDEETKNPEEKIAVIETTFSKYHTSISDELKKLDELTTLDRQTVNILWDSLADLRDYYTQVSFTMTSYNQWIYKKKINDLEARIQELSKKIPRTKFRFRRRKKRKEETAGDTKEKEQKEKEKHQEIIDTLEGVSNKKGETIEIGEDQLNGNYKLVNLEDCKVRLKGVLNSLFMKNIKNCEVWTCPVSNSVMIHEALGSRIRIIGHQIRLHDSYDTRFDVFTSSRLIIENCKRVKFAEFGDEPSERYEGFQKDFEVSLKDLMYV